MTLLPPEGRAELVKLATRLIIEEALEGESRDVLGRDYYERGGEPERGYRNGVRPGRLKTAEGLVVYSAPQIAGRETPFRSEIREHLKGPHAGAGGSGGTDRWLGKSALPKHCL